MSVTETPRQVKYAHEDAPKKLIVTLLQLYDRLAASSLSSRNIVTLLQLYLSYP
jgi:hypothetical protein